MKYVVFVLALVGCFPFGAWLAKRPDVRLWLWTAIGFLPFYGLDSVDINLVSYEQYRGDSRGIEITLVDLFVLSLALALPKARSPMPYKIPVVAYAVVAGASVLWAREPLFATFSVWKLLRMVGLLRVVSRGCEDDAVPPAILRGMAFGLLYELYLALQQRYVHHHHQVSGNFAHQNTFGMAVNLIVPSVIAMKLAGQGRRLALAVIASGAMSVVLTLSRGAMTMFLIGATSVFLVSTARRPTAAKIRAGLLGAVIGTALVLRAWDTIVDRFLHAPKESAEGRVQFEAAASLMLGDHPLGVGINGFSLALGDGGYGARVGVFGYDATGIVHNIYWLTAAEIGYLGFLAFVAVLASPIFTAFRGAAHARGDVRGDILLGLGVGLCLMDFQGKLEWAFRQTTLSYLFWTLAGVIAGLARAVRLARHLPGAPA